MATSIPFKLRHKEVEDMYKHLMQGAGFHFHQKQKVESVRKYFRKSLQFYISEGLKKNVFDLRQLLNGKANYFFEYCTKIRKEAIKIDDVVDLFMDRFDANKAEDQKLGQFNFIIYI